MGTHLDLVSEQKSKDLEKAAYNKYANCPVYPKVVGVVSISSTRRSVFFSNNMEKLRNLVYDVACHLQLSTDGFTRGFWQEFILLV